MVKAIHGHAETPKASSPMWNEFDPSMLCKGVELEFHPGALAACEQLGIL